MRILAACLSIFLASVSAATWAGQPTAPPSSTADFIQAVDREWALPRSADFEQRNAQLQPALQALCDASPDNGDAALSLARRQWLATLASWERLSTVAIGPLLERRSQLQIDFTPTRPKLIEKAVDSAPANLADMELIGTPAKGLPALEWMLWVRPVVPASPTCRYAVLVAAEIGHEAHALHMAFEKAAVQKLADPIAQTALNELVNQWVGGMERLSWNGMTMPVQVAITAKRDVTYFPHFISGATAASWAAQWHALSTLAAGRAYSIEAELRARAQNQVADELAAAVRKADQAMRDLDARDAARVLDAGRELSALKQLVENKVAGALGVHIGFSDADGD